MDSSNESLNWKSQHKKKAEKYIKSHKQTISIDLNETDKRFF